jgi:hypothetical protein
MVDLNEYICAAPFQNIEIHENSKFVCCPTWLPKEIEEWNDDSAKDIRKSMMDGSFKHCRTKYCPFLAELMKDGKLGQTNPIVKKTEIPLFIKQNYNVDTGHMAKGPSIIQFAFDRSCNFKCPSCRLDIITADGYKIKDVEATIEEIETKYASQLEWLYITGSGDPFVSVGFRNFLRNFDPKKYPKLTNIHLHTNASMWTKQMWNSMRTIWPYVTTCEISIDAGTQYTYENITRLGGKWETLINNLKFIVTIPKLRYIKTSFVVQDSNYMEMEIFLNLMKSILGKKVHVFFGKITNWGTFTDGQFKLRKVWDKDHPEYDLFLNAFNKVWKDPQVFHNMYEFIDIKKTLV